MFSREYIRNNTDIKRHHTIVQNIMSLKVLSGLVFEWIRR